MYMYMYMHTVARVQDSRRLLYFPRAGVYIVHAYTIQYC